MEEVPAAEAPPLPPPRAPTADAADAPAAPTRTLADGQVTVREALCSASTAVASGSVEPTELSNGASQQNSAKAHSDNSVVDILHELTTSVGINAELQCTLCHEVLCKPLTVPCGHSFCRVCLVEYLLSKELSETQCPICRGLVLHSSLEGDSVAPAFCINVTLWNIIQLLVPSMRTKDPTEEDADYALKYDQFDAKWRIAALQQSGPRQNRRRHRLESEDEIESSDEEMPGDHDDGSNSEDGFDVVTQDRRVRYPELRQENAVDGHLEVFRNVVQDRDDANEDGYEGMRVSLAVMEFPSLFQPFNEHQECSIVVLKCEEDEDMDGGIPFFTSDNGEDDEFIISDYYNEIRLRVTDDTGNVVMERTRGATQGITTFPNLRLDVPSGMYDFQFKDDLYGVRLTIRTEVRDLRDEDDNPELDHAQPLGYVLEQAGERSRSRGRRRHAFDEDEEDDVSESGSDDSFIVNDDEEYPEGEDHEAQFSGDEESELDWSNPQGLDEEEIMERRERARLEQRQRHERDGGNSSSNEEHDEFGDSEAEANEVEAGSSHAEESESEGLGHVSSVSSGRSSKRNRIVDDESDSEGDVSADQNGDDYSQPDLQGAQGSTDLHQAGRKRSRAIMESDDEEEKEEQDHPSSDRDETEGVQTFEGVRGFSSSKRLRQVTSQMFQDEDEEDERPLEVHRPRWVGSDPYGMRRENEDVAENGVDEEVDDFGPTATYSAHGDYASGQSGSDVEEHWSDRDAIDDNHDEDGFSE